MCRGLNLVNIKKFLNKHKMMSSVFNVWSHSYQLSAGTP